MTTEPFRLCPRRAFLVIDRPTGRQIKEVSELPRTRIFKIGAATFAAGVGVILAITSVAAHSTQSVKVHATTNSAVASQMHAFKAKSDAAKAAALLAAEKAKATRLAAKLQREAAKAAEEAAETGAAEADEDAPVQEPADTDTENEDADTEVDNDSDQTETQDAGDTQDTGDSDHSD